MKNAQSTRRKTLSIKLRAPARYSLVKRWLSKLSSVKTYLLMGREKVISFRLDQYRHGTQLIRNFQV